MSLPYPDPKNKTEGLKNFVAMALNKLQAKDYGEAELMLVDLLNDIGGAYVCNDSPKKRTSPAVGPVPKYNRKRDGDYSSFLAANNID
jgi:hypothetical protein